MASLINSFRKSNTSADFTLTNRFKNSMVITATFKRNVTFKDLQKIIQVFLSHYIKNNFYDGGCAWSTKPKHQFIEQEMGSMRGEEHLRFCKVTFSKPKKIIIEINWCRRSDPVG